MEGGRMSDQAPRMRKADNLIELEKKLKIVVPNKMTRADQINFVSEKVKRKATRIESKIKMTAVQGKIQHEPVISLESVIRGKEETTFIYKISIIAKHENVI